MPDMMRAAGRVWRPGVRAALVLLVTSLGLSGQSGGATALRVEQLPVDIDLSAIRWAIRLTDGTVIFADAGTNLVYRRDTNGRTFQLGRHGDGPGEYRAPENAFIKDDSVLVHASGLAHRAAIHIGSGRGESRILLEHGIEMGCRIFLLLVDSGLCEHPHLVGVGDPGNTLTVKWFSMRQRVPEVRNIVTTFDSTYSARLVHARGVINVSRPFHWGTRSGLTPSGRMALFLRQELRGQVSEVEIAVWDITSGQINTTSWVEQSIRVSDAVKNGITARMIGRLATQRKEIGRQRDRYEAELRRGWRLPDRAPPYRRLLVGDDGCVWLERTRLNWPEVDPLIEYEIRSLDGRGLGRVTVPRNVNLLGVTCADGTGVTMDADGIPELVRVAR